VRFGLAAVKNVGEAAVEQIVRVRGEISNAAFSSLAEFCELVDWSVVNRRAIDSLAKAGAMDVFGDRGGVINALDATISAAQKRQKAAARGQMGLFGGETTETASEIAIVAGSNSSAEILGWEKELLGAYMSAHPLSDVLARIQPNMDGPPMHEISQLSDCDMGSSVRFIAMIEGVRRIITKTNRSMAVVTMEDLSGQVEAVLFSEAYERHSELLIDNAIVIVKGKVERRGEALQVVVEHVSTDLPLVTPMAEPTPSVCIRLEVTGDEWSDIRVMQQVDRLLRTYEGLHEVVLDLECGHARRRVKSRSLRVDWCPELQGDLQRVSGILAAGTVVNREVRLAS
jgi:DNA polymerase III subunit alpha